MSQIIIQIKRLDGQKEPITVDSTQTVDQVSVILAEKAGVQKDQIKLIFQGKPLVGDATLAASGVAAASVIHMIAQLRG